MAGAGRCSTSSALDLSSPPIISPPPGQASLWVQGRRQCKCVRVGRLDPVGNGQLRRCRVVASNSIAPTGARATGRITMGDGVDCGGIACSRERWVLSGQLDGSRNANRCGRHPSVFLDDRAWEKGQAEWDGGPVARGSGAFLCPLRRLDSVSARCCALRAAAVSWCHQESDKNAWNGLDFYFVTGRNLGVWEKAVRASQTKQSACSRAFSSLECVSILAIGAMPRPTVPWTRKPYRTLRSTVCTYSTRPEGTCIVDSHSPA